MKALAITHKGMEDICALEIKELIKSESEIKDTVCIFDIKKLDDLSLLCYKGQSVIKVLYLIGSCKNKKEIEKIKLEKLDGKTFRVDCKRIGKHDFNSVDIEQLVTKRIIKEFKLKVDYDNPDLVFYVYINSNEFYLGIDFAGFDLSKRDYRIFLHPAALKATISYAALKIGKYTPTDILLDPFCGSGTIPIEAALFASKFPINHFQKEKFTFNKVVKFDFDKIDKKISTNKLKITGYDHLLKHVKAAQKNAKIAGVNKLVNITKVSLDWLDTKFEKNSVDKIITHPPAFSKYNEKQMSQLYTEFFSQAEYVLKKKGLIVIVSNRSELIKEISKKKFKLESEREVWQGQECMKILVLSK